MKRTMLYAVLVLLALGVPHVVSASSDRPVTLLVDGKRLPTSPPPVLRGGRVFIPVTAFRPIGLAVSVKNSRDAWVAWPETDMSYDFRPGVRTYEDPRDPRGSTYTIPGTPFVSRGALMVPLRTLLADSNYGDSVTAGWDSGSRTLSLSRSRSWLRWRLESDDDLVEGQPNLYSHVFLGDYVPVIPGQEIARAEKLDASGDWQGAVKVLRSLISPQPFPWTPERWPYQSEWLAYEPLGRILIRERPEGANGYHYLGIGLAVEGDYAAAETEFRRAAEIDPSRADAHFGAGWAVLRQEKVTSALERDPDKLRKALADLDRALEADPKHEPSLRASGYAWLSLAFAESYRAGYTDQAREQVEPYLRNAVDRFERLLKAAGPSPGISYLLETIRDQLDPRPI